MTQDPEEVLAFWFADAATDPQRARLRAALWFGASTEFDALIRERFSGVHDAAARGRLASWSQTARGALALVIVLDQFTRNLYRGTAEAFACDGAALAVAGAAIERGFDRDLGCVECGFLYMPFQHAEDAALQARSVALYNELRRRTTAACAAIAETNYQFAVEHKHIIDRFRRFPHRNKLLERASTEAERNYLESGGKTFGQS